MIRAADIPRPSGINKVFPRGAKVVFSADYGLPWPKFGSLHTGGKVIPKGTEAVILGAAHTDPWPRTFAKVSGVPGFDVLTVDEPGMHLRVIQIVCQTCGHHIPLLEET